MGLRIPRVLLAAGLVTVLGACAERGETPREVSMRFWDAFQEENYEAARALTVEGNVPALRELSESAEDATDIELYERATPFPLSAARAKGRRFDAHARRQAGLSEEFIEYVRTARPPQQMRKDAGRVTGPPK